ncbi:hypothetical protein BV20DRAFT_87275 [Pilatotrama ljubarskyi]|nr:hypothetical protein BV20DRAFT_87275 [Pilatotrama ljubarskyi]
MSFLHQVDPEKVDMRGTTFLFPSIVVSGLPTHIPRYSFALSSKGSAKLARRLQWATVLSLLFVAFQLPIAHAQSISLQVPSVVAQCTPTRLNWTGGVEPYTLVTVPAILTPIDIVQGYLNLTGHSFVWTPKYDTEALVLLSITDSAGTRSNVHKALISGGGGTDRSCLKSSPSSSTATSSASSAPTFAEPSSSSLTGKSGSQTLGGGAIAGIAIGVLAVGSLLALWITRRYNQKQRRQAFLRGHKSKRSDWQVLGEIRPTGSYPFASAKARVEKPESNPVGPLPPSPSIQRPSETAGSVASRRAAVAPFSQEPPVSPFN